LPQSAALEGKMDKYTYLGFAIGLAINCYVFWVFLQLTFASWGSDKASEKWVVIAHSPIMQLLGIKWVSIVLTTAISFQLVVMVFVFSVSIFTGKPIPMMQN
jgi:hypothetical protein